MSSEELAMLREIEQLCDAALGSECTTREPGAIGAVKALIDRYREALLTLDLRDAEEREQ